MAKEFPDAHLHLLSLNRVQVFEGEDYSRGKWAHLKSNQQTKEILIGRSSKEENGLYFRKKSTDFEIGLFLVLKPNQYTIYKITDGVVTSSESYPI